MLFKSFNIVIALLLFTFSYNIFQFAVAQTNGTINTFEDPKTGISFQYPSDWHVASKEYTNSLFGGSTNTDSLANDNANGGTTMPIVLLLPESLNGASFVILSELLPFPMLPEKYLDLTRKSLLLDSSVQLSESVPISIGNSNGYKYNVSSYNDSYTQTQIVFVKDSNAFVIAFSPGETEETKNTRNINSMIDSFKIK